MMKSETAVGASITAIEKLQRVIPGDVLFREGEHADGVYVLHEGDVDLIFSARTGDAKPLMFVESGQILGLSEVVAGHRHDATATARTPGLVGYVPFDDLLRILDGNTAAWFSVLQLLSRDLNSCWQCMRRLGTHCRGESRMAKTA
jgi:CRP/FNR family transcriptional regulator